MGHAASEMAAKYHLLIQEFGGCPTPVFMGEPLSGKTTALAAAFSVFGIHKFSSECSSKFIEKRQSMTTIPFGWDDLLNVKVMKNVTVNLYNVAGSATLLSSLKLHTVPLITKNEKC
ncbi:uncharacterized protein LOC114539668 [Dendronephthya gigantea]|uniref:uncharacterized protein LOC114539668 n=1 Tax=Dendronephthya gigantea TaxID=151771 RepID=UPI001068E53E|nr:uncharacterized protein LOC114539668 [Dendronephthya gigantea]